MRSRCVFSWAGIIPRAGRLLAFECDNGLPAALRCPRREKQAVLVSARFRVLITHHPLCCHVNMFGALDSLHQTLFVTVGKPHLYIHIYRSVPNLGSRYPRKARLSLFLYPIPKVSSASLPSFRIKPFLITRYFLRISCFEHIFFIIISIHIYLLSRSLRVSQPWFVLSARAAGVNSFATIVSNRSSRKTLPTLCLLLRLPTIHFRHRTAVFSSAGVGDSI